MNAREMVISAAKRPLRLEISINQTRHAPILVCTRGIFVPYYLNTKEGEPIISPDTNPDFGNRIAVHFLADEQQISFGEYHPSDGLLMIWLLNQIARQLDPKIQEREWFLTAVEPPKGTNDRVEYFCAVLNTEPLPGKDPIACEMSPHHLLHWSAFFEKNDPVRRQIHMAYKAYSGPHDVLHPAMR